MLVMDALSSESRNNLPDDEFAVPGKRKLPIENAKHVKLAWDLLDDTDGLTAQEKAEAKKHILAAAKKFDVDVTGWKGAMDRARLTRAKDRIALDRASVRTLDQDGHLRIAASIVTAAQVNDYYGAEITDGDKLGLDPKKVYAVFRPPEEIEKAAPTLQGKPLLTQHKPQMAAAHDADLVVGSVMNPEWKDPNLFAEIVVWDADTIKDIESGKTDGLSCGYWWTPKLESGAFAGKQYSVVMTGLKFNHVALVDEPRVAGAFIGDSNFHFINKESDMKTVLSRKAVLAKGALAVYLRPKMAADAKLDFNALLKGVTAKNFKEQKPIILERVKTATAGKLAQDADISDVIELLDAMEDADAGPEEKVKPVVDEDMTEAEDEGPDMEALKTYLKGKLSPEDHAEACKMMGGTATDEDPAIKKPPGAASPEKPEKEMVTKAAMDAAIAAGVKAAEERHRALTEALDVVRPHIGAVQAQDAASAYRMALDHYKVDHKAINELPALKALVQAHAKPAKPSPAPMAQDAAAADAYAKRFPQASRLATH